MPSVGGQTSLSIVPAHSDWQSGRKGHLARVLRRRDFNYATEKK